MYSGSPFLKNDVSSVFFLFSGKTPFSSDKLNKCFRGSLIIPKHLLTTLKFILLYPGMLFVFNEKKASFNSFIHNKFFPTILGV